jgi:hypothetical protein
MTTAETLRLVHLSRELTRIAAELETLWEKHTCRCGGDECPICLGLIHTSNDVETLASRCRDEANAADAAALDLAG